jgi:hypothetical protein
MTVPARLEEHTWDTFVRPAVKFKHTPNTRKLIADILPYFPKKCHCIAGYLNDEDQFWKVNFHWELLVTMLHKAHSLGIRQNEVESLLKSMQSNPPKPSSGYKDSKVVGEPHDSSSHDEITKRWRMMKSVKQTFRQIIDSEQVIKKHPPSTPWDLAAAPVAAPGTSKHGCGYALDIEGHGLNLQIKEIVNGLGATLAFDEKSHVHVEFKQGVLVNQAHVADNPHDGHYKGWVHGQ